MTKVKRNVTKQEELVTALWEFADDLIKRPEEGQVAHNIGMDLKISTKHVSTAMGKIMEIFGYVVTEVS